VTAPAPPPEIAATDPVRLFAEVVTASYGATTARHLASFLDEAVDDLEVERGSPMLEVGPPEAVA
jgi:hypothetical protein